MGCLDDMSALLIPPDEETAEEYKSLYDHVINWKDEIGTMEGVAPGKGKQCDLAITRSDLSEIFTIDNPWSAGDGEKRGSPFEVQRIPADFLL